MADEASDTEQPQDVQASSEGSGPISRSSVTHVAYIVSKFDEKKKKLVRDIGFAGIIELPHITKVDRKFTLWLLSKLDPEKRCIIVNGECITDVIDFEVARIMGIPCGRREVCSLDSRDKQVKQKFINNYIASSDTDINWLVAAENNVVAQHDPSSEEDVNKFKVSFVIWVMGHLLAPSKKHNTVSDRFWGALLVPGEISQFNWSSYVLDELINAARDVQNTLKQNKPVYTISGCSLLLQIVYFESIDVGCLNRPRGISPRVKVYDAKSLSLMIAADKASSASGCGNSTWGSTVRHMPKSPNVSQPLSSQKPSDNAMDDTTSQNDMINNVAKYIRERFGDKVSTSQSSSLNWFNARCIQHYNNLRLSIQNDMIDLIAKLFSNPNTAMPLIASEPNHGNVKARQARSEPCKPPLYGRKTEKNKRPFESYDTWSNGRGTKKQHGPYREYKLPENILCGMPVPHEADTGDQISDCGNQPFGVTHNSACDIEAPSFDLGIELNTDGNEDGFVQSLEKNSIPGPQDISDDGSNQTLRIGLSNASPNGGKSLTTIGSMTESSADDNCVDSSIPNWYIAFTGTPPSAYNTARSRISTPDETMKLSLIPVENAPNTKNKDAPAFGTPEYTINRSSKAAGTSSIVNTIDPSAFRTMDQIMKTSSKSPETPPIEKSIVPPTFVTPEEMIKKSSKSPGTLSKMLAEGDLVDRITHFEDSTDPNKKHWHGGYMQAPIQKRLFAATNLAESPWTLNLCHRTPPRDIVERLFDVVSASSYCILNRPWVAHNSPRQIELLGTWIHDCFFSGKPLSYDVFDLGIRRFNQLDSMMYAGRSDSHWRHILESDLAMYALAGEQPYFWNSTCEQFIGCYLQYKIEDCRMIVAPAFILLNWSCYIFDFKEECVHVIDPLYNKEKLEIFRNIHLPNVAKVADGVATSFEMFFNNWNFKLRQWDIKFVEPCINDATPCETGLLTLMYIREFDGSKIQFVDRDSFNYFKKLMLYELMSLSENPVKAPVSLTIAIDD